MKLVYSKKIDVNGRFNYGCGDNLSSLPLPKNANVNIYDFPATKRTIIVKDNYQIRHVICEDIPNYSVVTIFRDNDNVLNRFLMGAREGYKINGLKMNSNNPFYCNMPQAHNINILMSHFWNSGFPYHGDYNFVSHDDCFWADFTQIFEG